MKALATIVVLASALWAQRGSGELRLLAIDSGGDQVEARGEIVGQASDVHRSFVLPAKGPHVLTLLPFGRYRLTVTRAGFTAETRLVEVSSELPVEIRVTLGVAPVETAMVVRESETILNPSEGSSVRHIGTETIDNRRSATPGRGVLELVNLQPGWLLEANGILHPRGSEYQVQYVVDGIPLLDNRSPAFAQSLGVEEFASMNVRTAGYPAEFGRKMGGIIEVLTQKDKDPGLHTKTVLQGGSFGTAAGYLSASYSTRRTSISLSGEGSLTNRFLDPPVQENLSNHASASGFSTSGEHEWNDQDRSRVVVQRRISRFLVPNELLQERAGQRQDRTAEETSATLSHSHLVSPHVLVDMRAMIRDTTSRLWTNLNSTPIASWQDRGFRQGYGSAAVSANRGAHEWKAGVDFFAGSVRESFRYHITAYRLNPGNVRIFDRDIPAEFAFNESRPNREQGLFLQDRWRWRNLTLSAGVRFDHYRLVADESAFSPRFSASYYFEKLKLVLHTSFDRTFETPAVENILLASTNRIRQLGGEGVFLPLHPAKGKYYEAGFSKSVFEHVRLDATWYRRRLRHFQDDSLLLNTGVSFPVSFDRATIEGIEVKLEVPRWGPFSGFASYSNLIGRAFGPVSGGLFLGDDASELTAGSDTFAITQDQRNTLQARLRVQATKRLWFAVGGHFGSGLPVEIEGPTASAFLAAQYGPEILKRVNFSRGRVRPSMAIDFSAGVDLFTHEKRKVMLTADALNAADRLNVINFAGVFSGTAVAAGRTVFVRLQMDF